MNGIIGINQEQLHEDIETFEMAMQPLTWRVEESTECLFGNHAWFIKTLKEKWASEEANQLSIDWGMQINNIITRASGEKNMIIDKIEDDATAITSAIGGTYERYYNNISKDDLGDPNLKYAYDSQLLCKEFENGSQGIDPTEVRKYTDWYKQNVESIIARVEQIPTSISIYDTQGNVVSSTNSERMSDLIEQIRTTLNSIVTDIETECNKYATNAENAIVNATSGASGTITPLQN